MRQDAEQRRLSRLRQTHNACLEHTTSSIGESNQPAMPVE
jgi:hypothetical protein